MDRRGRGGGKIKEMLPEWEVRKDRQKGLNTVGASNQQNSHYFGI
jgi:hypothetical protein